MTKEDPLRYRIRGGSIQSCLTCESVHASKLNLEYCNRIFLLTIEVNICTVKKQQKLRKETKEHNPSLNFLIKK